MPGFWEWGRFRASLWPGSSRERGLWIFRSTHSRVVAVSVALMDTDEMDLGLRSSPLHYK